MSYLDAVAAFIKKHYKVDKIHDIEIIFESLSREGTLKVYKRTEDIQYDFYFFQPEEVYEAPDFLDFEYTVQLEDGNYVFWQED